MRGKILLITLDDCTVTFKDEILFKPEWGIYDMAIGKEVISAYAGAADVTSFEDLGKVSTTKTHKITYSDTEKRLFALYEEVRQIRNSNIISENRIKAIFEEVTTNFSKDWLLLLELFEIAIKKEFVIQNEILKALHDLKSNKSYTKLIENGLVLSQL